MTNRTVGSERLQFFFMFQSAEKVEVGKGPNTHSAVTLPITTKSWQTKQYNGWQSFKDARVQHGTETLYNVGCHQSAHVLLQMALRVLYDTHPSLAFILSRLQLLTKMAW